MPCAGDTEAVEALAVGPLRDIGDAPQLYFDLTVVTQVVTAVTAVVTGAQAVATLIDVIVKRLKPDKKIAVRIAKTSVVVTGTDDPEQVKAALRAALKLADA